MSKNIDPTNFKPAIVYTIYIAATPEKVWQALTGAEFSRQYFSGFAIEADLKVGGAFIARAPDGSEHISGEVIECDPPKKLTVTWNVNWPGLVEKLGPTLVTYEIEPAGDADMLRAVRRAGDEGAADFQVGLDRKAGKILPAELRARQRLPHLLG